MQEEDVGGPVQRRGDAPTLGFARTANREWVLRRLCSARVSWGECVTAPLLPDREGFLNFIFTEFRNSISTVYTVTDALLPPLPTPPPPLPSCPPAAPTRLPCLRVMHTYSLANPSFSFPQPPPLPLRQLSVCPLRPGL